MKQLIEKNMTFILYGAGAITLVMSGWVNKDSLIIPKTILLWSLAMYLIPQVISGLKATLNIREIKILTALITLMILNIIISSIISVAPYEQQFYGRTGRGLGIATQISLLILFLGTLLLSTKNSIKRVLNVFVTVGVISTFYTVLQSFGFDIIEWETRTHGLTGTLGNPNFQGALAACLIAPTIALFINTNKYKFFWVLVMALLFTTLLRTKASQGILIALFSLSLYLIIYLWSKNKVIAKIILGLLTVSGLYVLMGTLGHGYLSKFLYKVSVQSRGDFWRSAIAAANDKPFFGVGVDSFGDNYLKYRDQIAANHNFAEFTDNAHNYYLEYAATIGYFYMLSYAAITIFAFVSAVRTLNKSTQLNHYFAAVFISWVGLQLQSIVSPATISLIVWNAILTATLIAFAMMHRLSLDRISKDTPSKMDLLKPFSYLLLILVLVISYPYFNTDRLQLQAMLTGNGDLAIVSTQQFPESVLRYNQMTNELLKSNLVPQALLLARKGVDFNPNSASMWALVLINPQASISERINARNQILRLDPLNKEVQKYIVD